MGLVFGLGVVVAIRSGSAVKGGGGARRSGAHAGRDALGTAQTP